MTVNQPFTGLEGSTPVFNPFDRMEVDLITGALAVWNVGISFVVGMVAYVLAK